jgi:thioredoxin 1
LKIGCGFLFGYCSLYLGKYNSMAMEFTDQNFDQEVVESDKPTLVDFWAPWCGPCQMMGPIVEELATEMGDKVKIGKLNVDENPVTAQNFTVMSIPTILIFKDGKVAQKFVGVQSKEALKEALGKI